IYPDMERLDYFESLIDRFLQGNNPNSLIYVERTWGNYHNHVALISEQWGVEKQTTSVKNKSFLKNSIRTQQRHAKALKDAAVGSSKITDFFNVKASSGEDQPDELSDDGDPEYGWENAINSVEQALESPNLANELKSKLMAIGMYFRHLSNGEKKIEASEIVAVSLGWTKNYKSRCIRAWANQWIQNKTIPTSNRGKYPKTKSLWKHEDIAAQIGKEQIQYPYLPKKSCEFLITGSNYDGWWTTEKLKNQVPQFSFTTCHKPIDTGALYETGLNNENHPVVLLPEFNTVLEKSDLKLQDVVDASNKTLVKRPLDVQFVNQPFMEM
ncbi:6989_t:CDS:2, partial [Entrophospora sp. SA101]